MTIRMIGDVILNACKMKQQQKQKHQNVPLSTAAHFRRILEMCLSAQCVWYYSQTIQNQHKANHHIVDEEVIEIS